MKMYIPGYKFGWIGGRMTIQESDIHRLENLLDGKIINSRTKTYHCIFIDETCIVFSETGDTEKVMIPVDVALEWINALKSGLIHHSMNAREMRKVVAPKSKWARYQHGFETHLHSIVLAWNQQRLED
jgi:hypothetical protein